MISRDVTLGSGYVTGFMRIAVENCRGKSFLRLCILESWVDGRTTMLRFKERRGISTREKSQDCYDVGLVEGC